MRIILAHHQIQDWGGIVNYTENLIVGLRKLGHSPQPVMLKNKGASGVPRAKDRSLDAGWEIGAGTGLQIHQKQGWEGMLSINYSAHFNQWEELIEDADLIIWIIPVPTCTKANKDDIEWMRLYQEHMIPQTAVIHDGNMRKLYPHLHELCRRKLLEGIVCVHDAAFNSASVLPVKRALIPNPHNVENVERKAMQCRESQLVSLQTFKRWKRVDDLIRAIPHMDEFHGKVICGGGIEYHYMTSKNKCKKEYMTQDGERIWDVAVQAGMDFRGYVTTEERDALLGDSRLLVDPSWSKNYCQLGAHFNRVMIEAMVQGCVPVCTDLGMANSSFFKAGINYLEVPYDIPPEAYGKQLSLWMEDLTLLEEIQENNFKLIDEFDSEIIADLIISLSDNAWMQAEGASTPEIISAANKKMAHFLEEDL